ncbi:histone H3-K56 acetyltransferase [Penicillium chermesinum]|uniref:histone acetyltransferase n=1 Tax=Penicillium chermesinum TaxID=63820 RepID=A0A9W9NPA1_9EURO|nr:histone H3-K56 acetyltransferase [Penicillium chermesinum]KAJ5223423.1 histone H3-K56 acetyltransferase [Penicillium chermesinum]
MALDGDLGDLISKGLPTGAELTVRHISSTPAPSAALFAAAPGHEPEPTFCESHFLSLSIDSDQHDGAEVIVFGMEVLVYNSAHLTTIFVSKADSTGFLHLLKLPKRVSILRFISHTFLSYLVRTHQRPGVRLVVSLFARAQDQYLFPGSIENSEKHVLDDRGLIKWWCRAIDPILREYEPESASQDSKAPDKAVEAAQASATAYLIVPGSDRFETRNFSFRRRLRQIRKVIRGGLQVIPCIKCAMIRRLRRDDELPENNENEARGSGNGQWRSVKTLDQFWEMMSFRQECSAGRLVGFLWLVINPPGLMSSTTMASQTRGQHKSVADLNNEQLSKISTDTKPSIEASEQAESNEVSPGTPEPGKAASDAPKTFDRPSTSSGDQVQSPLQAVNPFFWPEAGRGHVVLSQENYKEMMDGVLDHFYDKNEIVASTKNFVDQVTCLADQLTWGQKVTGTYIANTHPTDLSSTANTLDGGLVRKRKPQDENSGGSTVDKGATENSNGHEHSISTPSQSAPVTMLNSNLVRKKKKT